MSSDSIGVSRRFVHWLGRPGPSIAVGALGVAVLLTIGAPVWLLVSAAVIIFFLAFLVEFSKGLAVSMAPLFEVPEVEPACPRCAAAARTPSGWCPACTSELETYGSAATDPVRAFEQALRAGSFNKASRFLANRVALERIDGTEKVVSRARWRRDTWILSAMLGHGQTSIEVSLQDPADPEIVWVRSHGSGQGRLKIPAYSLRRLTRYRVSGPTIAAISGTKALPPAPRS